MEIKKIRAALADVHLAEKSSSNPTGVSRERAEEQASKAHGLSAEERGVLRRGLNLAEGKP